MRQIQRQARIREQTRAWLPLPSPLYRRSTRGRAALMPPERWRHWDESRHKRDAVPRAAAPLPEALDSRRRRGSNENALPLDALGVEEFACASHCVHMKNLNVG